MSDHDPGDGLHHHVPHSKQPDLEDQALSYYQTMALAVSELLIDKNILSAEEFRAQYEVMDNTVPALGARLVVRAWRDRDFKARMLKSVNEAAAEFGVDAGPIPIKAVENTAKLHNVIVCTLCSCYPRYLLGLPPDWYKSRAYRSRVVREPRAVLREFGTDIPDHVDLVVHDSTADFRYLVLPLQPDGTDGLSDEALADLVTRDSMIGVSFPKMPEVTNS
ncbi:MAG: nitrile hydratase subunit alpha [Methyloligellaceae bacterium]